LTVDSASRADIARHEPTRKNGPLTCSLAGLKIENDWPFERLFTAGGQGVASSNLASPTGKGQVNALIVIMVHWCLLGRDPNWDPNCELDHNGPQRTPADPSRLFDPTSELADVYPAPRCQRSTGRLADRLRPRLQEVERVRAGVAADARRGWRPFGTWQAVVRRVGRLSVRSRGADHVGGRRRVRGVRSVWSGTI
jgi:hypothetical protein